MITLFHVSDNKKSIGSGYPIPSEVLFVEPWQMERRRDHYCLNKDLEMKVKIPKYHGSMHGDHFLDGLIVCRGDL